MQYYIRPITRDCALKSKRKVFTEVINEGHIRVFFSQAYSQLLELPSAHY